MPRARSRRVQAQRKFAQGAYVPPNVVAVAAAENRRDAAQDPRNVTINNVTATGLLDVVSLQSYSNLTSQPVVIVERLRGRNPARDVPPPTQTETVEPRPWVYPHERVNNNVATIKKPDQPPKLQTVKKKKEYKRNHPMSLRSRRQSNILVNQIIAESNSTHRKVASKRTKNSSDEDEPLIFQKTRLQQTSKQTAARESAPKENTPKPSPPKEKSPKKKPCKKKTIKEIPTHDIVSKEVTKSEITRKKITTNQISLREADRRNVRQGTTKKQTVMKRAPQTRIHKKCSPKQPEYVAPKFSVAELPLPECPTQHFEITVIKEDLTDEMVTPDDSVIVDGPNNSLTPDVLDDLVAPGVPVATDDPVVPPVPVMQDASNVPMVLDNESLGSLPSAAVLDQLLASLDDVFSDECNGVSEDDEPMVNDDVAEVPDDVPVILHDVRMVNDDIPKVPVILHDVPMVSDDVPVVPDDVPVTLHDVSMVNDDVPEVPNEVPMVNDDVPEDTDDVPTILHNVPMVNDDVPEDTDDVPTILHDVPMVNDDVPEDTDDVPTILHDVPMVNVDVLEDTGDPDIPFNEHDVMVQDDMIDPRIYPREVSQNTPDKFDLEVPTTCVAAEWRSDQDVINASQDLLDSRCKVCRPCIRIEKLITISSLLTSEIESTTAVLERTNEPEREIECENLEIDNDEAGSTNPMPHHRDAASDDGHVYLQLPKHSFVVLKLRTSLVHGKDVLGVRWIARDKSLKNQRAFSLEEQEHLLDQLIETLTNTEGRSDNLEEQNHIPEDRRISISSDSTAEMSDTPTHNQETSIRLTAEKRRKKRLAVKKKLAEAELMQARIREEKEKAIARLEEEKRQEISRIMAEKSIADAEVSRYHERFTQMEKAKKRELAHLEVVIRAEVISKIEAKRRMDAEVDGMAANLAKEKDAKKMDLDLEEFADQDAPGTSSSLLTTDGGLLVDAPVYHPTEDEFTDPLLYYEKIWPEAVRYGICKVVPPPGWKPPFRVNDEIRFDVTNQYISRLFSRWGPAARELCAIKMCLAQQKVNFTRAPLLDGVEVNLPKLYHLVQRHGGLETVYNKKRWGKVADDMKFNKGPNTERKLDQIYVKYLLPYDTLSHQERQDNIRKVEMAWNRKNQKLLDRSVNPLNRQMRLLGLIDSSDEETEDEDTVAAVNEAEDCIIKGVLMNRAKFKKIATMMYENTFGPGSEAADPPDLTKIEELYWRLVTLGTEHVCVHTAAIDTGEEGYGFIKNKSDSYGRHPWNPKMVGQNLRNVLAYLGPVLGVTVPTLLLGMLFSTSCWHKDPHAVSWLEYQLLGPERIWYGIPAHQADNFRKAVETLSPTSCQNKGLWLPTDITMIPPNLLREHNVTLSRVTQRDGEYIMAFPNAYTCCISTGYTESESVYFAPPFWLKSLWTVFKEARESCEPTMFAMEHLLYNIGKDPKAEPTILKMAQPLYDKMLREEVTNRQMLQERGLTFVQDLLSANTSRKKNKGTPFSTRDHDECEYCRATLYLSKVKGLTDRNTVLCLEHALKLLDTEKYKDMDIEQLQVLVHVSVKELNTVHDDMKRRLGIPIA